MGKASCPGGMIVEAMIGEIRYFAFGFAPKCWLPCNGMLLPLAQFTALTALLWTRYGGDGTTTFALPMIPTVEGQPEAYICVEGRYPIRA